MSTEADVLAAVLNEHRWQTQRELARRLNTSTRSVRAMIGRVRRAGELPIMADNTNGYRLARTPAEYAEDLDGRRRRAVRQLVNVRGERAFLRRWLSESHEPGPDEAPGQEVMPWA